MVDEVTYLLTQETRVSALAQAFQSLSTLPRDNLVVQRPNQSLAVQSDHSQHLVHELGAPLSVRRHVARLRDHQILPSFIDGHFDF